MQKIIINQDFEVDLELLKPYSYFNDIIQLQDTNEIIFHFDHNTISNFIDYLLNKDNDYTSDDIEFGKYIISNEYLSHIINYSLSNSQINEEIISWIFNVHLTGFYVIDIVIYFERRIDDVDKYIPSMYKDELYDFIKAYPLFRSPYKFHYLLYQVSGTKFYHESKYNRSYNIDYFESHCRRTKIYLKICQIAYDLFGDEMLKYINNDFTLYEWVSLFEFLNIDSIKFYWYQEVKLENANGLRLKLFDFLPLIENMIETIVESWK